ncbi:hypothetical protein N0V90_004338 [Kalmusia sp. IMI 367209]|nr:hypothetical protein N0V90_004338 [Kalmusia sp. IMI 367209]
MFTKAFIVLIAVAAVSAAPTAKAARDDLQPWKITQLFTHSPSGRPGNDPHSTLNVTIQDPNAIPATQSLTGQAVFPPTSARCTAQWLSSEGVPWGVEQPCTTDENTTDYSTWTFTVNKPDGEADPSATENFNLEFKLVDKVTVSGTTVVKKFAGGDDFEIGTNLSGQCGGSGVCNWSLSIVPYDIQQAQETDEETA